VTNTLSVRIVELGATAFEAVPAVLTVGLKIGVVTLLLAALRGWRF